jgi:hypothetical protein
VARHTEEIAHENGGSIFMVTDHTTGVLSDGGVSRWRPSWRTFSVTTSDEREAATVITIRDRGDIVSGQFTLSRDEAIGLMAHLSEVTG